jgi:hypothetical protein
MKCIFCERLLVNVYYREGAGGKKWVKVPRVKYCKNCGIQNDRKSKKINYH